MTSTELSADLVDWAALARYGYVRREDWFRFSTEGGGTSFYIRPSEMDHGWFTVTESERREPENLIFSAASLDIVEKYFWADFGFVIRMSRRLPRLVFSLDADDIAEGYSMTAAGQELLELRDPAAKAIAKASDELTGKSLLAELSHVIGYSAEELHASYLDAAGHPIFPRTR